MSAAIGVAWLHYVAVMLMAGGAVAELYLLKLAPTRETVLLTARADRFYGIGAVLVLLTGLARMPLAHGGKGVDYYLQNGAFHGAIGLFILAALISLRPTLFFLRQARGVAQDTLPDATAWRRMRGWVHAQLALLVLVALSMPMIARGIG